MEKISQKDFAKTLESFGNNFKDYMNKPIQNNLFIKSLEKRAQSFSVKESTISLGIIKDQVFDFGGIQTNESTVIAMIDFDQSKGLVDYLSQKLSYDVDSNNTTAIFVTQKIFDVKKSKKFRAPTFRKEEYVVVFTIGPTKSTAVHILRKDGLKIFYYREMDKTSLETKLKLHPKEIGEKLDRYIPPIHSRYMGLYNRVAVIKDDRWYSCPYKTNQILTSNSVNYEVVTVDSIGLEEYDAPANSPSPMILHRFEGEDTDIPAGIVSIHGGSDDSSGIPGIGGTGPGGTGDPGGQLLYGPPQTGNPCTGYQTIDGCKGCIATWAATAIGTAAGIAAAVCASTGWFTAGASCAVAVAAAAAAAAAITAAAVTYGNNCEQQWWKDTTPG